MKTLYSCQKTLFGRSCQIYLRINTYILPARTGACPQKSHFHAGRPHWCSWMRRTACILRRFVQPCSSRHRDAFPPSETEIRMPALYREATQVKTEYFVNIEEIFGQDLSNINQWFNVTKKCSKTRLYIYIYSECI